MNRPTCPECGKKLKLRRTADGKDVLVCENYPFCRYQQEEKYTTICNKCGKINCICEDKKVDKEEDNSVINKIKKKISTFYPR